MDFRRQTSTTRQRKAKAVNSFFSIDMILTDEARDEFKPKGLNKPHQDVLDKVKVNVHDQQGYVEARETSSHKASSTRRTVSHLRNAWTHFLQMCETTTRSVRRGAGTGQKVRNNVFFRLHNRCIQSQIWTYQRFMRSTTGCLIDR